MADPRIILLDEPAAGVNPSLLDIDHRPHRRAQPAGRRLPAHRAQYGPGGAPLPACRGDGGRASCCSRDRRDGGRAIRASSRPISAARRMSEARLSDRRRSSPAMSPALPIVRGVDLARRAGRDRRHPRPERRRQVDARQGDRRPRADHSADRSRLTAATSPARRRTRWSRHGLAFVPQTENIFTAHVDRRQSSPCRRYPPEAPNGARASSACYALFPDLARQRRLRGRPALRRPAPDAGGRARADRRAAAC